jgi:hydroxymethylbilane synthase
VRLRLGTRGSALALAQSGLVAELLRRLGLDVQLVTVVTAGDARGPDTLPGEGVFVAALESALLEDRIDLAVHSAKDIPLEETRGLVIAAYPVRADARDALVTVAGGSSLSSLPAGTRIGTDSPRRAAFARRARPDLQVTPLHGNVDTRLRRLDDGDAEALVLATAGLDRLGRQGRIDQRLDVKVMPPAPAQGALAIQVRHADGEVRERVATLDDAAVRTAVAFERAVLKSAGGGCRTPLGIYAETRRNELRVFAAAATADGAQCRCVDTSASLGNNLQLAAEIGRDLAAVLSR